MENVTVSTHHRRHLGCPMAGQLIDGEQDLDLDGKQEGGLKLPHTFVGNLYLSVEKLQLLARPSGL